MGAMHKTTRSKITALDIRRVTLNNFKKLLGEIPLVMALEGKGAQESWLEFKHHFLHSQDRCIPKSKKGCRRPAWLSRELLKKLKRKKKVYRKWKKGLTTWEDNKNAARACRDETRKAKASLELSLARDVKLNRKGFFKYIGGKRKNREVVCPLLNETGAMVMKDAEKVVLLKPGSPGGQQDDHEPAMCPCGQKGQWHPGLHQEVCGQQVEGGHPPPLLCLGEAASGVLCPVLGSPVQEGQGTAGEGAAESYQDDAGTRTPLL